MTKFCVGSKAHVFLSRKAVTIKCLRPWVTLAGEHWGAALPYSNTQATTWLDETEGRETKCYTLNTK